MEYKTLKYILFSLIFLNISLFSLMLGAAEPEEPFSSYPGLFCSNPIGQDKFYSELDVDTASLPLWADTTRRWVVGSTVTYSINMDYVSSSDFINICTGTGYKSGSCSTTTFNLCNSSDTSAACSMKLQNYIKPIAEEWELYGNIELQYITSWEDADIRIKFADDYDKNDKKLADAKVIKNVNWSAVGIGAKHKDYADKRTMVLGVDSWKIDESTIERKIRHEFGHALGLRHEHLRFSKSYTVNKDKTLAYYMGPPNNWTEEKVNDNVLDTINVTKKASYIFSEYDPYSIMQYEVPSEIVTNTDDCPEKVTKNTDACISTKHKLSAIDKTNFKLLYPYSTEPKDLYNATSAITGISIASSSNGNAAQKRACPDNTQFQELIDVDLNAGAGGNYIYMCLARNPNGVPLVGLTTTTTLDSCPADYEVYEVDLNQTVGGEYIYLCAKYIRPFFGSAQPIYKINIARAGSRVNKGVLDVRGYDLLAKDRCLGKDNNEFPKLLDKDLNAGAGGDWIFLCSSTFPDSDVGFSLTTQEPQDRLVKLCNTSSSGENISIAQMSHIQGYTKDWISKDLGSIAPAACKTFNFGKNYTSMVYFYAYTSTGKEWPVKKIYTDRKFCVKQANAWSFSADHNEQCEVDGGFLMRGAGYYLKEGINTININPELNIRSIVVRKRNADATAGGTVKTALSSAINCGTACIATFKGSFLQDKVTLNATPNAVSNFAGWRGCTPAAAKPLTCTVTVTEDKIVEAFFTRKPVLIADKRGRGHGRLTSTPSGLDCGADCIYEEGGTITVTAVPDSFSDFAGWSGIGSQNCNNSSRSCQVSIDSFHYLVAEFDLLPSDFTLAINKTGNGSILSDSGAIDCGLQCQKEYPRKAIFAEIARVSLTPVLEAGSVFSGWNGACAGKGECRLIMDRDQNVSATFAVAEPQTFVINNLSDSGTGSLRQAIIDANNNPGADTITLAEHLSGTIILTSGSINITDSLSIEGPGANELTISGNNTSRVFEIATGVIEMVVISGITIKNGHVSDGEGGGGIYISSGDVIIKNSVLSDNTVVGGSGGGAAIRKFNKAGSLTIINCSLFNNSAIDTIDEFGSADGGAIRNDLNQLTVINSTFSANKARFGGAVYNPNGSVIIQNSTIAGNTAESGGGIYNDDELVLSNTIISGNISPTGIRELDSFTLTSKGYNLFGENGNAGISAGIILSQNDLIHSGTIDSVIEALADNGGTTPGRLPVKSSPVINAGNNILIPAGINTDQRGENAPRIIDGIVDIGAIEYFSIAQKTWDFERSHRYVTASNVIVKDGLAQGVIMADLASQLINTDIQALQEFKYSKPLKQFEEILGAGNQGSIQYQLINNGIAHYYDGSVWKVANDPDEANSAIEINQAIHSFHTIAGYGQLSFNAFFMGDDSQNIELDSLTVSAETEIEVLSITQVDSSDPVFTDQEYNYVITVTNHGLSDAKDIEIEDILPIDITFVSALGTNWSCAENTGIVTCKLLKLLTGASSTITITLISPDSTQLIEHSVAVFTSDIETNLGNNLAIEETNILSLDTGFCGSSHQASFFKEPTNNLCAAGTASSVTGTGPWIWHCLGKDGTDMICNADKKVDCTGIINVGKVNYISDKVEKSAVSIITDGKVVIKKGVAVFYQAPEIILQPGFHAEAGSTFSAEAMTVDCNAEALAARAKILTTEAETIAGGVSIIGLPYELAQWLSIIDLPVSLQQFLNDKNAQVREIQSDASGKVIVFSSETELLDNDTNRVSDIYLYKMTDNEKLSLVSHTLNHIAGNGASTQARINGSGDYIVYRSKADNLLAEGVDRNGVADIYLYHISSDSQSRINYHQDGSETSQPSNNPALSANASYLVYDKADSNQQSQIYAVDISSDELSGIKVSTDYNNFAELIDNSQPGISADGRYVAYLGQSKDENKTCTQHILDRETGNNQVTLCPDVIAENPEQWFPFFDGKAENILWQQIK